mgnify:CR=1 FL=1
MVLDKSSVATPSLAMTGSKSFSVPSGGDKRRRKEEFTMRELIGVDLFIFSTIAITTNGTVQSDGQAVMGRGCALTAKQLYPGLPTKLGRYIREYGNLPFNLGHWGPHHIFSFPTKHNWWEEADPQLIIASAKLLMQRLDKFGIAEIAIPRPGCGFGKLTWTNIRPILLPILDDRCIIVHK